MLDIKFKIFPTIFKLNFHRTTEIEVTILCFFLATEGDSTKSFGTNCDLIFFSFIDVNILAISKSSLILLILLEVKITIFWGTHWWIVLRLNSAIFLMEVDSNGFCFLFIKFFNLIHRLFSVNIHRQVQMHDMAELG